MVTFWLIFSGNFWGEFSVDFWKIFWMIWMIFDDVLTAL